jgi:GNAT superfamily N-acetyltransferase
MELKNYIRNDTYSVQIKAVEGDKVVGWAFLIVIKNDRHNEPYGLLENVYVEQEYRHLGLGGKLVRAVIEEARRLGCYKLLATTRYSKPEVQAWYLKLGFHDHGKEFRIDLVESKTNQRD